MRKNVMTVDWVFPIDARDVVLVDGVPRYAFPAEVVSGERPREDEIADEIDEIYRELESGEHPELESEALIDSGEIGITLRRLALKRLSRGPGSAR